MENLILKVWAYCAIIIVSVMGIFILIDTLGEKQEKCLDKTHYETKYYLFGVNYKTDIDVARYMCMEVK